MLSRSEKKRLLKQHPDFEDISNCLRAASKFPNKAMLGEIKEAVALARKFNREVVRPQALELDRRKQQDNDYLPWDFVHTANNWGFYSKWIPRFLGGGGYNFLSLFFFLEEIASECPGMANLIGVHYLGVGATFVSFNLRVANHIFRQVAKGEKEGKPCLLTACNTEPSAGSDLMEPEMLDKASVSCHAKKVDGGYLLNGTKIFISSGHLSQWHNIIAFEDPSRPAESTILCLVNTDWEGFSFGRQEKKMGQKGCPASELIFKDCFVPDEYVAMNKDQLHKMNAGDHSTNIALALNYFFGISRAGVAAFGTGTARGAYEKALDFALQTRVNGKLLINHEWAQSRLAEMNKNAALARLSYVENTLNNGVDGMIRLLHKKPLFYFCKYFPFKWVDRITSRLMGNRLATWLIRSFYLRLQSRDQFYRSSGWGSLSKFASTDAGMTNSHLAVELMGQAGIRQDMGAEKFLRDAKLFQIYEGTNQITRVNMFESFAGRHYPQARAFEQE